MIKRTLLTAVLYMFMVFSFFYVMGCFVQWEIIVIPALWDWTNEQRLTLFLTYLCLCSVAFMVEADIKDKKKRLADKVASDIKSTWDGDI